LFVTTVSATIEAFLLPYAKMLQDRGWRVDALARGATANSTIRRAFDSTHDIAWSRRPWDLRATALAQHRVAALVMREGYDVVHVHTPVAAFVTRHALRNFRPRPTVVYTAHGFHFHSQRDPVTNWVFRALETRAAGWTDLLVTMNSEDYQAARGFPTIAPERVRLIPGIGVDCGRYAPLSTARRASVRASLGLEPGQFAVAIVGEFTPNKRQALAVDALLAAGHGFVGVFIGEGAQRHRVEFRAKAKGIRALFLGHRPDAGDLIAACDAMLHVSRREGVPRVVLEASAAEVPVIGTMTRGTIDILRVTGGTIVKSATAEDLGAALRGLAQDPGAAQELGKRARNATMETFGLPRMLESYSRLYDEALTLKYS
jgi:glycosyltransferase involved in cell wall biosynthesis